LIIFLVGYIPNVIVTKNCLDLYGAITNTRDWSDFRKSSPVMRVMRVMQANHERVKLIQSDFIM